MIRNYQQLLSASPRFFIFSICGILFSAPGQTFLISLAIPSICDSLQLSPLRFASIYSLATVMASFFLPLIGKLIDQWPLRKVIYLNSFVFTLAIVLFSYLSSESTLFFALFFMRLFGQGALTLTSTSITIKQFTRHRGSALSITQLGYPLSEFIFPGITILLIGTIGWRYTFLILAVLIPTLYLPLSLFGSPRKISRQKKETTSPSKSLGFALRDPFFPLYVSLSSIPPIMMTATLYFQVDIFTANGWPLMNTAIALFCYACFKFLTTLIIGPLIDRFGIIYAFFFLIFSIGLATVLISLKGPPLMAFIYYALFGAGLGTSASTTSYLWGLLYGSQYIGEIKGAIAIVRNGATAIAPICFSYLLYKLNIPFERIFLICGSFILLMSVIPFLLSRFDQRLKKA